MYTNLNRIWQYCLESCKILQYCSTVVNLMPQKWIIPNKNCTKFCSFLQWSIWVSFLWQILKSCSKFWFRSFLIWNCQFYISQLLTDTAIKEDFLQNGSLDWFYSFTYWKPDHPILIKTSKCLIANKNKLFWNCRKFRGKWLGCTLSVNIRSFMLSA